MKKLINKNTLFGILIGGLIFGFVGVEATKYMYYANQISYQKSEGVETDVVTALNELYEKSGNFDLTLIEENVTTPNGSYGVYTSKNIDIKNFIENNNLNVDYTKLTVDNFILTVVNGVFGTNAKLSAPSFAPEITNYDQATGILTISKISYVWHQETNNGFSKVQYYVNVYMK